MNALQEAKLNMYHAVINHGEANAAILATVPAFDTAFSTFKGFIKDLETNVQSEALVISGIATDKQSLREDLCQQATDLAAVVFAYASSINNNTLKEQVNFSLTDLKRLKDDELAPTCRNINNLANDNLAALAPYGITAGTLTTFSTLVDEYDAAVPTTRNAASLRATYRTNIEAGLKKADDILKNQLDKTAVQFKTSNLEFYNTYKNNRIILDPAVSSTQIEGNVADSISREPIVGATVEFVGLPLNTTTVIDGTYILKNPKPGIYAVKFSKTGYKDKTVANIELKLGQSTTVIAELDIAP